MDVVWPCLDQVFACRPISCGQSSRSCCMNRALGRHTYNLLDQSRVTDSRKGLGDGQTTQESPLLYSFKPVFSALSLICLLNSFWNKIDSLLSSHTLPILTFLPAEILLIFKVSPKRSPFPSFPPISSIGTVFLVLLLFLYLFLLETIGALLTEKITYSTFIHSSTFQRPDYESLFVEFNHIFNWIISKWRKCWFI